MDDGKALWSRWQALMRRFTAWFTRPGWVRFTQWVTGTVLCWEEHTITQILTSMGLESRWRVLESFAEYGAFDCEAVERLTVRLIEEERPARWAHYHPVALDDTKEHRTSEGVWGTCTHGQRVSNSLKSQDFREEVCVQHAADHLAPDAVLDGVTLQQGHREASEPA